METHSSQSASAHRHIPALDGLRGMAVLMVVFFHFGGGSHSANPLLRAIAELNRFGSSGVTLFFLLSGFLITGILWDSRARHDRWRTFFIRRTLRISPLYYLTLLLLFLSVFFTGPRQDAKHVLLFAVYGQNLLPAASPWIYLPGFLKCYHLWSLAVEEQFYLLWPFLIWRMRQLRSAQSLCLVTFLLSLACRLVSHYAHFGDYEFTVSRVGELAVGAWMALALRAQSPVLRHWQRHAGRYAVLFAAVVVICALHAHTFQTVEFGNWIVGLPATSMLYGSILLAVLQPGRTERLFSIRPLRFFGTISYGLYIFHVLLYNVADVAAKRIAPHASHNTVDTLKLILIFVICVPLATASFRWFEQPFLRLKDRLTSSTAKPTPARYLVTES